jgi:diguanylate cyclase (GGDEF)-like protein/PAS domain S-box-containing protein
MLDREMRYLYVSQHWISSYGLGDRNLQGLYHYDVFPQIGDDWKNVHRRGLAGEVLRSEGDCFVTNDGSLRWLRWEIRPWYTVQGSIGGIVIFSEDITASKAAVVALQESEARTRARSEELDKVLNAVPAAVWIAHDEQSRQITGNSLSYQWLRIPQGANPSKSAPEDERPQTFRIFRNGAEVAPAELPVQVAATGVEVRDYEYDIVYPDGEVRHMFGNATPLWDEQGKPRGSVSAFVDITARKHAELALREQEESFRLIAENLNGFIATLDAEGRRLYNSPAYARLLGDRSLVGTWSFDEVHADDRERVIAAFREAVATGSGQHLEYRFVMADGSICVLESRSGVVRNDEGRTKRVVVVSHDITERRRAEEAIHHLAFHDGLTQLPNRLALYDRLRQSMAAGKRSGCYGALMFLDLDNFKSLNDTHGHEVGDLLLIEAAARLRNCVRAIDTVARFGGDEFVVILGDLCADQAESTLQAARVAEKIRLCVAEPYSLNVRREGEAAMLIEHRCTVSIGIVLFLGQEASQDDLLKWADAAMYRAKTCEQNLIRFHASSD